MQDSLLYFKNLLLSLLAIIGLITNQKNQELKQPDIITQNQTALKESSRTSPTEPQEIIDQNPVSDTEIRPEDFNRIKMFSESFCGPLQSRLFQGIITMNLAQIDEALTRGADINKPTNCIFPLDEAIEGAITRERFNVVEHLCEKGAIISNDQLRRLIFKKLLYDTNKTDSIHENDLALFISVPKGAHITSEENIAIKNSWLERKKSICDTLLQFLAAKKDEQARLLQPEEKSTNSAAAAAAQSGPEAKK